MIVLGRCGNLPVAEVLLHRSMQPRRQQVHCKLELVGASVTCTVELPDRQAKATEHRNCLGQTALHCCALNPYPPFVAKCRGAAMYVVPGAEHLAQLLVDASADVHAVDEQGETPLQIATRCGADIVSRCAHYHFALYLLL